MKTCRKLVYWNENVPVKVVDTLSARACISVAHKASRFKHRQLKFKSLVGDTLSVYPRSTNVLTGVRGRALLVTSRSQVSVKVQTEFEHFLNDLITQLSSKSSIQDKITCLESTSQCRKFLESHGEAFKVLTEGFPPREMFILLCIVVLGQDHVLINVSAEPPITATKEQCQSLVKDLLNIDKFYNSLGGILGYHLKSLQLIRGSGEVDDSDTEYLMPKFLDLSKEDQTVQQYVRAGIDAVPYMGEIYALGGSGDRLGLQCPESGDLLPSAMLPYCGRSMLDSMIRDLEAREYLYFKLTGHQYTTPIAIMTSDAKDNDHRIREMLKSADWYGRGEASFFLFKQPLVPLIDIKAGKWLVNSPGKIVSRPGGHGVIWKLMFDTGVFNWLESKGARAVTVRQVSNPLAATDTNLFGLCGMGYSQNKSMGFASCERVVGASEGMNVVQHKTFSRNGNQVHEYGITNIEYTEFERLGLTDIAIGHNSSRSCFPANTNILYISLNAAKNAVQESIQQGGLGACLPGLIFNTKKVVSYTDEVSGEKKECLAGRMECMMQNIADSLVDAVTSKVKVDEYNLSTFMVCNTRRKVTSSAKRKYVPGASIRQTPEGSFWDLMLNARGILTLCGMKLPKIVSLEDYLKSGPGMIFLFNPCLGPLWSIIKQKIHNGQMSFGSELVLDIAEVQIDNLNLSGSLIITSENIPGHREIKSVHNAEQNGTPVNETRLVYSSKVGKVIVEDVTVENNGIDWAHSGNVYWKHEVSRTETCLIHLHGNSEFKASGVKLIGELQFIVPDGYIMELSPDKAETCGYKKKLTQKTVQNQSLRTWHYKYDNKLTVECQKMY